MYSLRKGVLSSGVQFLFWILITVSQIVRIQTVIRNRADLPLDQLENVVEIIYLPLVVAMVFINCWADFQPKNVEGSEVRYSSCDL